MKKMFFNIDVPDDFKPGQCKKCLLHSERYADDHYVPTAVYCKLGFKELSCPLEEKRHTEQQDRAIVLLKAARNLLAKQQDSGYVLNLLAETVHYDDAECDGSCLLDDIGYFLEEVSNDES